VAVRATTVGSSADPGLRGQVVSPIQKLELLRNVCVWETTSARQGS
jgi:hypothetical protein